MRITALRPARTPGYLIVELDGARVARLPIERVRALGLARGQDLDGPAVARLEAAGQGEDAYRAAVRLLVTQPRSVHEVILRLRRKKVPQAAVAEAVGRLEAQGLLDDAEFARAFARARAERGYGPVRIRADLATRGVERRLVDLALADVPATDQEAWQEELSALARKRAERLSGLPTQALRRRLIAYLHRRGFPLREVLSAVDGLVPPAEP
jgi:regulatory protein